MKYELFGSMADEQRLARLRGWYEASYGLISDAILESFPVNRFDAIQHRLLFDLRKCPARSPKQLREWCRNRIAEYASEITLIERLENPTVQDVLAVAALRPVDDDAKPFVYEQHGDKVFIRLEDSRGRILPWIIPAEWLPVAKALWPVHVRKMPNGRLFVSKKMKKQRLNGTWHQFDQPVHHLFLNAEIGARVDARNGSYLDYTNGNLTVHNALPETQEARERSLYERLTADWLPAKSNRAPKDRSGDKLNSHERSVLKWLRGEVA